MGHRGFGQTSRLYNIKQSSKEENYSRAPNSNARDYFKEMAPINGFRELTEEQMNEAQARRDEFRDAVSKRMGEMLLRGVTMLDAYCQACNGILMEDRNGVRTCVTCELFADRTKEGSRLIAEVPLDATSDGIAPGNTLLASEEQPVQRRQVVNMTDVDRKEWAGGELQSNRSASTFKSRESRESTPNGPATAHAASVIISHPPTFSRSMDGFNAALLAVDRKLKWASEKVERSENVSEIREIFALINEGMRIIKSMKIDHN